MGDAQAQQDRDLLRRLVLEAPRFGVNPQLAEVALTNLEGAPPCRDGPLPRTLDPELRALMALGPAALRQELKSNGIDADAVDMAWEDLVKLLHATRSMSRSSR